MFRPAGRGSFQTIGKNPKDRRGPRPSGLRFRCAPPRSARPWPPDPITGERIPELLWSNPARISGWPPSLRRALGPRAEKTCGLCAVEEPRLVPTSCVSQPQGPYRPGACTISAEISARREKSGSGARRAYRMPCPRRAIEAGTSWKAPVVFRKRGPGKAAL